MASLRFGTSSAPRFALFGPRSKAFALVVLTTSAVFAATVPTASPRTALEEGKLAYQRSQFPAVESTIKPLLYPTPTLETPEDILEARRLLALAYFFQRKPVEARQEVLALFVAKPDFKLDPAVDPQVAVNFFETIRKEQVERYEVLVRKAREEAERKQREEAARAQRILVERQIIRRSRFIAMVPFGVGQYQNGDRGKAIAFGVTEGALALLSIASYIADVARFPNGEYNPGEEAAVNALVGLEVSAGVAAIAVGIIGIIEAQVRLKPETIIERELLSPKKKSSFMFSPFGVGGRF